MSTLITRRRLLATSAAAMAVPALPANASILSLNRISNYLNGLQTAQAKFTQINPDGTVSTGQVFIKRPGRARFEYDPPEETLVMAGAGKIAIFDPKSNLSRPEQYPLGRTPLNIILERNVDLSRRRMVVGHEYDGVATTVVAQDPDNPQYGRIELKFTSDPVELRQWIVVDGVGTRTTIVLGEMTTGLDLPSTLFNISYEADRRSR
ncbi:MAG: outer membrane lipoprotein carrier protein LolA [Rhodobacteraceae bacterium]|nr:outer membrane lipoprotein carrier protein LolA [Paracoccaceae bacterium]